MKTVIVLINRDVYFSDDTIKNRQKLTNFIQTQVIIVRGHSSDINTSFSGSF